MHSAFLVLEKVGHRSARKEYADKVKARARMCVRVRVRIRTRTRTRAHLRKRNPLPSYLLRLRRVWKRISCACLVCAHVLIINHPADAVQDLVVYHPFF